MKHVRLLLVTAIALAAACGRTNLGDPLLDSSDDGDDGDGSSRGGRGAGG